MLGGVVELQAAQDAPRFGGRERLVEGAGRVGRQVVLHNADVLGLGIMDIDELAHELSVVFCCPSFGDLDLAPGTMHVEDDEEIDGAVAAVLVIVAFELARLGRNWLAHLTDELDRTFVEADHRSPWIWRFGIEVEHVFHAGDIFSIDMGNAPHVLAPRLDVIFGQPSTNRLVRQALMLGELDHRAGQQLQGPAGATLGRTCAGRCHQQGFFLAGEFALRPRTRLFAQRPLQIAFHETPLGPVHCGAANRHRAGNLVIAAAGVGGQQYLGSLELAGGMLAPAQHRGERLAFGLAQFNSISYIHLDLLVGGPNESTDESKIRRCSSPQWARLYRKAGPVSGLHLRLFAHLPTPACRGRHAAPLPRQPTLGPPDGPYPRTRRLDPASAGRPPKHRTPHCPRKLARPKITENKPVKTSVTRY